MKLIEFYTSVLKTLALEVTPDGHITHNDVGLVVRSLPVTLPTPRNVGSLVTFDQVTGKAVPNKVLFNPLSENQVRGDSDVIKKIRAVLEATLQYQLTMISNGLLACALNEKKETPPSVNRFLVMLESARTPNIKKLVDDDTINKWSKLIVSKGTGYKILKVFLAKSVTLDQEEYFRGVVIDSPLLDTITSDNTTTQLRPKDKRVFKTLIEYILRNLTSTGKVLGASNDKIAPTFMALSKSILSGFKRNNSLIEAINSVYSGDVNGESPYGETAELFYTNDDLNFSKYASQLALLPTSTSDGDVLTTHIESTPEVQDDISTDNSTMSTSELLSKLGNRVATSKVDRYGARNFDRLGENTRRVEPDTYGDRRYQARPKRHNRVVEAEYDRYQRHRQPRTRHYDGHPQPDRYRERPMPQERYDYQDESTYVGDDGERYLTHGHQQYNDGQQFNVPNSELPPWMSPQKRRRTY